MAERSAILRPMNRLSTEKRAALVAALVEGNSVRATARMTDVAFNTVLKFVVDIGGACAYHFMTDLAERLTNRVQLTTDGHKAYLFAVAGAFGADNIDYAMLVKLYGTTITGEKPGTTETRYSPPMCLGARPEAKFGDP